MIRRFPSSTRIVFRVGPWVLKLPKGGKGVWCNLAEAQLWQHTHDYRLVPTLWSFFGLANCMPYAGPVQTCEVSRIQRVEALRLKILDPAPWNIGKLSVGKYGSRWAFVDYACTPSMCTHWCIKNPCDCCNGVRTADALP